MTLGAHSDWSVLRALALDRRRGTSTRELLRSLPMDGDTARATLRRLADAGLVAECRSSAATPVSGEDTGYRVSAKGMAVLLNSVML